MAVAIAALLLAPLGGCVRSPEAQPTQSPIPHATPIFSSDKEALAAATKAYAAYVKVSDEIARDGGAHPERIRPYVTKKQFDVQSKDLSELRTKRYVAHGSTTFDSVRLERYTADRPRLELVVYLCVDVSGVRLLNPAGEDVTPEGRPDRLPLEVVFLSAPSDETDLLVDESNLWSGNNFC